MAAQEIPYGVEQSARMTGPVRGPRLIVDNDPPEIQEGFLYDDYFLPQYSTEVDMEQTIPGKVVRHRGYGKVHQEQVQMNDEAETRYNLAVCQAENPRTDIWIVKDTAWGTQPDGGLNIDVARKLMGMGFNMLIKGPEIGSSIPLSQSAYHTHKVLDALHQRGAMQADALAIEGYSRGSMIAFGTNAYAAQFGRKILYNNLTDPCVALPVKADKETAKKAATLTLDLALLGVAIAKGLADPRRGHHLVETVDLSPKGGVQFVRTGIPLMNGEAGKLASQTPMDMHATIAFFRRCRVNDEATYRAILANRDGVRFVRPEGGHGGGIDKRIIGNVAVRFARLRNQLEEGRQHGEIDYTQILHGQKMAA